MQTNALLSLLIAAVGINAAPALEARLTSIPVSVFNGPGCNEGPPVSIANVPTDGECFGISAIMSGTTNSVLIDSQTTTLPPGCSLTLYSDTTCSSVNYINVTTAGQCFTFGGTKFVLSAETFGTC